MPIQDIKDATDVQHRIKEVFEAENSEARLLSVRQLFVEILDFQNVGNREVPLYSSSKFIHLPEKAHLVAELDGVTVAYVDLTEASGPTNRVRLSDASDAIVQLESVIGDVLAVFINKAGDQLHFIWPKFGPSRPTLRRIVVERDLPMRTAVQQLSNIYWNWQDSRDIDSALDAAFDVEAVTTKFFTGYRKVFNRTENLISCNDDDLSGEDRRLYVQTLFNRLMFVYFLSRKGWLRFNGDSDYLNAIWDDYAQSANSESNFYTDRLEQLFFAGLNDPRSRDVRRDSPPLRHLIGDVPFLNGGLFTKDRVLDRDGAFNVPDEAVQPILSELFDRFNFTVLESTPFDIEVAVDPEMLGKVFEETVNARHDSGAFYTPRPVVAFMCREALKGYLASQSLDIADDALTTLVDEHSSRGVNINDARKIAVALERVTVVDPACGSGAYLLGMMQELVGLQTALYDVDEANGKDLYTLKLDVIERNLFGADQDKFAVNIAMLRLWLSLAIEYEGEQPLPLPNLDYQILCGDSLAAPDPSPQNYGDLFRNEAHALSDRLTELKAAHMQAFDLEKWSLVNEIDELEDLLRDALSNGPVPSNSVDWRIKFPEVFDRNGGFDIVIANPPYVRQEEFGRRIDKASLLKQYNDAVTGQSDLYCYFYVRGLQLLNGQGIHVFVSSNSWLDVKYGTKLKDYLLMHGQVLAVYDSSVERQFTTAQINTIISVIEKSTNDAPNSTTTFVSFNASFEDSIRDKTLRTESVQLTSTLSAKDKWGGTYLRSPHIYRYLMEDFDRQLIVLETIAEIRRGKTTGANDFFILDNPAQTNWNIEPHFLKPVMRRARDFPQILVNPSDVLDSLFVCDSDVDRLDGTNAIEYIHYGESKGLHLKPTCAGRSLWYNLQPIEPSPLAMMYQTDTTFRTYSLPPDTYSVDIVYTLNCGSKLINRLCKSMNSIVSQLTFAINGRVNFGGGLLEIKAYELRRSRIVDPKLLSSSEIQEFGNVRWDVMNPSPEQRALDEEVGDALGLTSGELEAVYEAVQRLASDRSTKSRSVT